MSRRRIRAIILVGFVAAALGTLGTLTSTTSSVSMRIHGLTVRPWEKDMITPTGSREYVAATLEVTNTSKQPIKYWGWYSKGHPGYTVLQQTRGGWKAPAQRRWVCGTGLEQFTLAPSESLTFEAVLAHDKPCKIEFSYTTVGKGQRSWLSRGLRRLTQRLPW